MFEFIICLLYGIMFLCVVKAVWKCRKPCNLSDREAKEILGELGEDAGEKSL